MNDREDLAEQFEEHRAHLRAVAYRMLGSVSDVDDAVQEAWLRLSRVDSAEIENLRGWLTTVVARVCLDMLRARQSRREEPFNPDAPQEFATGMRGSARALSEGGESIDRILSERSQSKDPEQEALMADSVGVGLLVMLDRLTPAERLAFVLHDMFGLPFEEIGPIVGRSTEAARQLASRARRRVRGGGTLEAELARQREVVEAFLAALRAGDFEGLLAVLDPDLVVRPDMPEGPTEVRGAANWAKGAVAYGHMARVTQLALVDGEVGIAMAPQGRLLRALRFTIANDKIAEIEVIGNPARLGELDVSFVQ